jgi:CRP-like cAMP-binding protein
MESKAPSNIVEFNPGEFVIKEKTPGDAIFIIKTGQLEVFKTDGNGGRIPLGIIGAGQYVGESAVLHDTEHTSNVIALTKVTAIRLSKKSVDQQLKQVPSWLVALTKGLITRLRHANDILRKNNLVDEGLAAAIKAAEQSGGLENPDDSGEKAA